MKKQDFDALVTSIRQAGRIRRGEMLPGRVTELEDIRQLDLVWEARSINFGDEVDALWLVCVTCSWYDLFLVRKVFEIEPTSRDLWEIMLQAIQFPETGEPHCPKKLMVQPKQGWEALKSSLKEIGILLVKTKELEYPDGFPEWTSSVWTKWHRRKMRKARKETKS